MEFMCEEILFKILSYLTQKDRFSASATCKRFYYIVCEQEKNRFKLRISNDSLQNREIYTSMINSKRIFSRMHLKTNQLESLESFWKLKSICYLKGEHIRELAFEFAKLTATDIIALLNYMPNLQVLSCLNWKIRTEFFGEPSDTLKLAALRELNVKGLDEATADFFLHYLPHHVLTSLTTHFYNPVFMSNQKNIMHLKITTDEIGDKWISLPLKSLSLSLRKYKTNENNQSILHSILQQQEELTSLDINECGGIFDENDESFIALCNLKHLKILKMNIDDLSNVTFSENFHKLDKLEELLIESVEHNYASLVDIIEELSNTRLEHLKCLSIQLSHVSVPIDRIVNMGRNFKQLNRFILDCDTPLPAHVYLTNLRALSTLEINYHYSQEFALMCSNLDDLIFPNITSIKFDGFNFGSDVVLNESAFSKLISVLPSVQFLHIEINLPLNIVFFTSVLQKLPKLRSIKGLNFVERDDDKFSTECIKHFLLISDKVAEISIVIKVKTICMNLQDMKDELQTKYSFVAIKRGICGIEISLIKSL